MKSYKAGVIFTLLYTVILFSPAVQSEDQVYGYELMTKQERMEHRNTMRTLKTEQERERYRLEHHKKMQKRAEKKGLTLPDTPQPRGKGMMNNEGRGSGGGQGSGGGRGR